MSDLTRLSLPPDFPARVTAMLPGITAADWTAFDILTKADKLVTDDNRPHPAFVNWCEGVLSRE